VDGSAFGGFGSESDGDFFGSEADESEPSDSSLDAALLSAVAFFVEDLLVDEESLVDDDESGVSAYAIGGVLATANPTPMVTANAPTRPMYLA
jgi:hypothetical protein